MLLTSRESGQGERLPGWLASLTPVADLRTALAVPRPKVSVPRRIDRAVERPRLLRDLTGAPFDDPAGASSPPSEGPVVLLACAPAGYGKTTMLADWTDEQRAAGVPVAWVTCDRDDDGTAFWSAVITAATEAAPDSATVLAGLDAPAGPADSTFVANLIGVLGDEVPGLVLVLDDVHEVRAREVLDGIQHLVEWVDGRVRVALGCRFEPPIGLHRLRLTGRLHEVRAAQLAFTAEEANSFWDRHDVVLDAQARSTLLSLTEGWPAGMRMAALSLEHGDDPARFVEEFSGADRPVADYLAGEVLVRLPDDVVDFLLRTSIVEDLAVDLAARLSGRDDSAAMLDDLAQRNALVVPLDRSGTWFRYHSLLRTYLAAALQRRAPGELATLQRVAAQWFLEQREPGQALELASAAGDAELVEQILLSSGLGLLLAGAGPAVRRSIAMLPRGRRTGAGGARAPGPDGGRRGRPRGGRRGAGPARRGPRRRRQPSAGRAAQGRRAAPCPPGRRPGGRARERARRRRRAVPPARRPRRRRAPPRARRPGRAAPLRG